MVFTRAQVKRKAMGEPIYIAPPARRQRRGRLRTNINDLPDELLILIIAVLDDFPGGYGILHALSTVNHRFNRLSVPFLYSSFDITSEDDMQICANFLRTTLDAPQLACFTKTMYWNRDEQRVNLSDTSKAIDFVHTLKVPFTDQWVQDILDGCGDAVLAVQICPTPKLVNFYADSELYLARKRLPVCMQHLLHAARGLPFGSAHNFRHLSNLHVPYCSLRPCEISAIFMLPSLRTLDLVADEFTDEDFEDACLAWSEDTGAWECPARSSTIQCLRLSGTLPAEAVSTMIGSCSSLLKFRFSGCVWLSEEFGWYHVVGAALLSQSGIVKRISFDSMYAGWHPPQANSIAGHFSQLASFSALDTYAGPLAMILGPMDVARPNQLLTLATTLPPSIRHLLLEVSPDWDPSFLLNVQDKSLYEKLPQIKRLYIRYPMLTLDNVSYKLLDLANFFANCPIEFSFMLDFRYKRMCLSKFPVIRV